MNCRALIFAAIVGLSGVAKAADIDWEPDVYPKSNLFPSLLIGTACVDPSDKLFPAWKGNQQGDPAGSVGASITGLHKGDKFKLVVEANDLMKESSYEGTVAKNSKDDLVIHPKVSYNYDRLANITQVMPFDITMELFVNGESKGRQTVTVTVRSVNDCLFGVDDGGDDTSDYSWLFTAYVNEDHPWVDRILKEALQSGIVSDFDGYQADSADDVLIQIFAIWNVMQRHGMKYSDITTTAAERDGVYSQHVRLFDEAVTASQANCVDGSVLLAALLRKIGLRASLVLVPEHMFIAVDLDDDTQIGIETTMMGDPPDSDSPNRNKRHPFEKLAPKVKKADFDTFEDAVSVGTDRLKKDDKKFQDEDEMEYQIIDLADARRMGILPIRSGNPELARAELKATPTAMATATPAPTATPLPTATPTPEVADTPRLDPAALVGKHPCHGRNPDGSAYEGTVEIRQKNGLLLLEWNVKGEKSYGTGLLEGMTLGVGLESGVAIYQIVPQTEGKSLIGLWATEGASKACEENIFVGDTDVAEAKFPIEKINGPYRSISENSKDGQSEEAVTISGGDFQKKILDGEKSTVGEGILLNDGLAIATLTGLSVFELQPDKTLAGHSVDKSGKLLPVSLIPGK